MIKSVKKLDTKLKTCPNSLMSNEISGNNRKDALRLKAEFDEKNIGKTSRLIRIGLGKWKEVWE